MIGGVVGVVWAMRERLISIPAAREPNPTDSEDLKTMADR